MLDMSSWEEGDFWPWFHKVACGHAAGGVVARKLMPSSTGGDDGDEEQFRELCNNLNKDPNINIDCEEWWKKAQKTVAKILEEHPQTMDVIKEQALALQEQIRPVKPRLPCVKYTSKCEWFLGRGLSRCTVSRSRDRTENPIDCRIFFADNPR